MHRLKQRIRQPSWQMFRNNRSLSFSQRRAVIACGPGQAQEVRVGPRDCLHCLTCAARRPTRFSPQNEPAAGPEKRARFGQRPTRTRWRRLRFLGPSGRRMCMRPARLARVFSNQSADFTEPVRPALWPCRGKTVGYVTCAAVSPASGPH